MFVLRNQPKGVRFASFGLGLCVFALMPTEIGYQDIASLLARQPGVAERWQKRVASAASNIQLATYSFGRPIGTSSPQAPSYRLASLDNHSIDVTGSLPRNPLVAPLPRYQASDFPKVDRTLKGDRLATRPAEPAETVAPTAPAREDPSTSNASVKGAKTATAPLPAEPAPLDPELQAALNAPPLLQYDLSLSLETKSREDSKPAAEAPAVAAAPAPPRDNFSFKTSSLFFGSPLCAPESIDRWRPGEEPTTVLPAAVPDAG